MTASYTAYVIKLIKGLSESYWNPKPDKAMKERNQTLPSSETQL
jgi:hypothetical protein